jgi:hypothetical protein
MIRRFPRAPALVGSPTADKSAIVRFSNTFQPLVADQYGGFAFLIDLTRGIFMKKMIHLLLATLLLLGAVSTSSFADGGAPRPMCSPGNCPQK